LSIKRKLAIIFSIIVSSILLINSTLHYLSTSEMLVNDQIQQMESTADEIRVAVEHSELGQQYAEDLLGEQLRLAAIAALKSLDKDAANVTNEQLAQLAKEIGVSHITLFQRKGDDIVGVKSSDPHEVNLSTKEWGYWYTAFNQLFDQRHVTIPEGQKLPHYWSGPIGVSSSNPDHIDKWGYYYDGTTNYIIDPYYRDIYQFKRHEERTGPKAIVEETVIKSDSLLEITAFNPNAFGKEPIVTKLDGNEYIDLENRPIRFGDYTYTDGQRDVDSVQKAAKSREIVSYKTELNGRTVLKTFVPVEAVHPYVIGLVTDYQVVQDVLNRQLLTNTLISIGLILFVFFCSSFIAGYTVRPVQLILRKVDEMAQGHLEARIPLDSRDELGQLANGINAMSQNLQVYTEELRSLFEHNSSAIFSLDLNATCLNINPMAQKITGYTAEEVRGRSFLDFVADKELRKAKAQMEEVKKGEWRSFELFLLQKDGHQIEVNVKSVPIVVSERIVGFYLIVKDITESKKTEELLRKSDKLAVVGQLAAGVAHEIRNPLTAIKGFVQLISKNEGAKREYLDIMLSELDRIELIIHEFLVLAKPQAVNYQQKDLLHLLQNIIAIVETQAIMSNVQILMKADPDIPTVECEENQLKQVFINVLKNALEAMPDGGTITI